MFGRYLQAVQFLVVAILLAAAIPVAANPVPYGILLTHVRPYDEYAPPIDDCYELSTHTTATGWVDFEIYAYVMGEGPPLGVDECQFQFTWPAEWDFDQGWYPIPHGGSGTVTVSGNQASVNVTYPNCPTTPGELFLLLKLSFWVEGYGELGPVDYSGSIGICYPGHVDIDYMPGYGAQAAVVCDYGYADCAGHTSCQPEALTPVLELQVNQGDTAQRMLVFEIPGNYCSVVFTDTETWMSHTVGEPNADDQYPVTLTVNTAGLALGYHEGYVSARARGASCTLVELLVLDLTGVEATSWSRIKSLY